MILGIDPGLSGALCWYNPNTGDVFTYDMPVFKRKRGTGVRLKLDAYALATLIDSRAADTSQAVLEQVSAMPRQGVSSAFNFGHAAGMAQMAVCAHLIPLDLVTPAFWKKVMRIGSDKNEARAMASALAPLHQDQWSRAKDDGRAEAFLLTQYWMRAAHGG